MKKSRLLCGLSSAVFSLATSLSHAAILSLEGRLETSPGSGIYQAYYDPNLDITWAADANITGVAVQTAQVTLVAGLNIGGITGWRLASADVNGDGTVVDCSGGGVTGCADNEMGFLYWEEGITPGSPGPFTDVMSASYWTGTEAAWNPGWAWLFRFNDGSQGAVGKGVGDLYGWAVHDGDVATPSAVPVPAAVWLFGSGLIGLICMTRRKKAA